MSDQDFIKFTISPDIALVLEILATEGASLKVRALCGKVIESY